MCITRQMLWMTGPDGRVRLWSKPMRARRRKACSAVEAIAGVWTDPGGKKAESQPRPPPRCLISLMSPAIRKITM